MAGTGDPDGREALSSVADVNAVDLMLSRRADWLRGRWLGDSRHRAGMAPRGRRRQAREVARGIRAAGEDPAGAARDHTASELSEAKESKPAAAADQPAG